MSDYVARPRYAAHRRVLGRADSPDYRRSLRPCAALAYRDHSTSVILVRPLAAELAEVDGVLRGFDRHRLVPVVEADLATLLTADDRDRVRRALGGDGERAAAPDVLDREHLLVAVLGLASVAKRPVRRESTV